MTTQWNLRSLWAFIVVFLAVQLPGDLKAENEKKSFHKTAIAIRINGTPPQLDGVLDDEAWKATPLHEAFTQQDPDEGKPATELTTFQVVYDDEAIYFGVVCYDSEPDKIFSRLVRRDDYVTSDRVDVILDPHYSRQNALWFSVYPSGSVTDGTISNGGWWDSTWNGVWEVKTKIHKNGWTAEYKIPYHVLRFAPKEKYTWGLQVARSVSRKKEYTLWRFIKKTIRVGYLALGTSQVLRTSIRRTIWNSSPTPWGGQRLTTKTIYGGTSAGTYDTASPLAYRSTPQSTPILGR